MSDDMDMSMMYGVEINQDELERIQNALQYVEPEHEITRNLFPNWIVSSNRSSVMKKLMAEQSNDLLSFHMAFDRRENPNDKNSDNRYIISVARTVNSGINDGSACNKDGTRRGLLLSGDIVMPTESEKEALAMVIHNFNLSHSPQILISIIV